MEKTTQIAITVTLFLGMFVLFTGIGMVNAILVELAYSFETTVSVMGQLATLTAVTWAVIALFVGPLSDVVGHKFMVIVGSSVIGASMFLYASSPNMVFLIISSILFGLGGAMAGPNILSCVGDCFKPQVHGRMTSVVAAATPAANLLGVPLTVLISGSFGWNWSFLSLGFFVVISLMLSVFILPNRKQSATPGKYRLNYIDAFLKTFRSKTFLPVILANIVLQATFWLIATYFAAFLLTTYTLSSGQLASMLSVMAVGQLFGTLVGGSLADRFDRIIICSVLSLLIGILGVSFIAFSSSLVLSVVLGGAFMGLNAASRPAYFSLMITVSTTLRGTVMGMQATSNHLGRAAGAALGGIILRFGSFTYIGYLSLFLSIIATFLYVSLSMQQQRIRRSAS